MKLVGLLIALVAIVVLVLVQLRGSSSERAGGAPPERPPEERFMRRCQETAPPQLLRPKEYCLCLWKHGVTDLLRIMTSEKGRLAAVQCRGAQEK